MWEDSIKNEDKKEVVNKKEVKAESKESSVEKKRRKYNIKIFQ